MNTRAKIFAAAFALAAAAGVNAQTPVDKSFTASGNTCADVNWSAETLAKYPNIGKACQGVTQRDGSTFVKFEGTVKKVAKGGSEITMGMKGSDARLVLNPDPNRKINIGGNTVPVRSLKPGDSLTFYVPDSRLVAVETPEPAVEEIPIGPPVVEQMAMTTTTYEEPLPKTASSWPLAGLLGALCIGFALVMRTRRSFGR